MAEEMEVAGTPEAPVAEAPVQEASQPVEGQEAPVQQEAQAEPSKEEYVPLGKYMEQRREGRAMKQRVAELEQALAGLKQGPSKESTHVDDYKRILAGLSSPNEEERIAAMAEFHKLNTSASRQEFEAQQKRERYESFTKDTESWLRSNPAAKTDPEFEYNIVDIIQANGWAKGAVARGEMSPDAYKKFIMSEYNSMMNPETEESKIKDAESSRSARRSMGSPQGGTTPRGKKVWTEKEVKGMSPEEYAKHRDEIEEAINEGRVKD